MSADQNSEKPLDDEPDEAEVSESAKEGGDYGTRDPEADQPAPIIEDDDGA